MWIETANLIKDGVPKKHWRLTGTIVTFESECPRIISNLDIECLLRV